MKTDFGVLKTDVDVLKADVEGLKIQVQDLAKDFNQSQRWQDRTWDVVKWVGGISAALSISGAITIVGFALRCAAIPK